MIRCRRRSHDRRPPATIWTAATYNRIARYYDAVFKLVLPIAEKARYGLLKDLEPGSILDVACGTGTLLAMAYRRGLTCYGIDTSVGMLRQARRKVPDVELRIASLYRLPYADECFDYVVETNAVSAIGIDANRALAEMVRVCRRGGEIRIADYAKPMHEDWQTRLLQKLGAIVGDYPHDYPAILEELGLVAHVETLGGHGTYQLITAAKS